MYNLITTEIKVPLWIIEYQFKDLSFVENLKKEIDKNVGELSYKTKVKARMTDWKTFNKNEIFLSLLNKTLPVFKTISINDSYLEESWGNLMENNDYVEFHNHLEYSFSGILYLTENGPGTYFPEFDKVIEEKIGKIVFFSSFAKHGVKPLKNKNKKEKRYTIAFNFKEVKPWN
jgi:hypothetical protein